MPNSGLVGNVYDVLINAAVDETLARDILDCLSTYRPPRYIKLQLNIGAGWTFKRYPSIASVMGCLGYRCIREKGATPACGGGTPFTAKEIG